MAQLWVQIVEINPLRFCFELWRDTVHIELTCDKRLCEADVNVKVDGGPLPAEHFGAGDLWSMSVKVASDVKVLEVQVTVKEGDTVMERSHRFVFRSS